MLRHRYRCLGSKQLKALLDLSASLLCVDVYSVDSEYWLYMFKSPVCRQYMLEMNISGQFTQQLHHKMVNSSPSVLIID